MAQENRDYSYEIIFISKALDLFGICSLFYSIYYLYLNESSLSKEYLIALIFIVFLVSIIFPNFNIYQSWRGKSKLDRIQRITTAWLSVLSVLVLLSVILKTTIYYSRVWFFSWSILSLFYLIFIRHVLDLILNKLRSKGWNQKNIVIFGAGVLGEHVQQKLSSADWTGFNILAFFDDDISKIGSKLDKTPIHDPKDLVKYIKNNDILELWIALPLRNEKRVQSLLNELRHSTITVKYVPDIFGFRMLNQKTSEVAGIPIVHLNSTPLSGVNSLIKTLEDKVLATVILVLISPIMILIAILIKLESKGPILFKQKRHGWNGKEIKVYKFRSMVVHEEENGKVTQAKKNDSRITKIGAFIRKTSLDELPQFINVLQGRMSIVGPRPHAIAHNEEYKDQVDYYMQRHRVKPGITGWAQINGYRGETDTLDKMSKRVEYDLFYIQNWSLFFDLKIIFLTIFKGFVDKNAY